MKIGIDVGGSHIATGIVLEKGKLLAKETKDINFWDIDDPKRVENILVETIKNEIDTLLKRYDYSVHDISRIGVAVPGVPDGDVIRKLVNIKLKNFDIVDALRTFYSDARIKVGNDGQCAGLAEKKYGMLKKYDDCIFLCMGTGVGGACFIDGELFKPAQFGHMIIEKNGRQCKCGKKGCFETYASMKRFKSYAIERLKLPKDFQSEELQNYIRSNLDKKAVADYVDEYLDNVATGIWNVINFFAPEAICFGGSYSYYSDIFLPRLSEKLDSLIYDEGYKVKLICAKLKNDAGIIGATEL